jgi:uncharacterized protein
LSTRITYLDSSAVVKLATRERETGALRRFIHRRPIVASSALARTEVLRALRPLGPVALRRARMVLGRLRLIRLDDVLLESAALLDPMSLRTLDAIHLATVLGFADDLEAVVTYDARMRSAAVALGLPVVGPA